MFGNSHGIVFIVMLISLLLVSCDNTPTYEAEKENVSHEKKIKDIMRKVNRRLVVSEDDQIDSFAKRHRWNMQTTGDGLRYWIYKKNKNAQKINEGDFVEIAYSLTLLTGDTIYTSSKKGLKSFVIGKRREIRGLEEGILLMKKDEQAKFIIPSHLAYGLPGDGDKIPKKASLVFDVKIVRVNKK
jgi:FKBP-type peptidyl-prolyl cis-trans isomerase